MKSFNVRLKLKDVIKDEKCLMSALQYISKKITLGKIKIWHNSNITKTFAENFQKKWPIVEVTDRTPEDDYIWFEIITVTDNIKYRPNSRFKCFYSSDEELLRGIFSFYNHVLDSLENNKPKKVLYKKENHERVK